MHDQFDDKLSGRIRDVFDNFEDGSADMGWAELRKKFPGEQKTKPLIAAWWWQSAAVLVMALGTWAYFNQSSDRIYLTGKPKMEAPTNHETIFQENASIVNGLNKTQPTEGSKAPEIGSHFGTNKAEVVFSNPHRHFKTSKKRYTPYATTAVINTTDAADIQTIKEEESRVVSVAATELADSAVITSKQDKINALEKMMVSDMLLSRKSKKPASLADLAASEEKTEPKTLAKNDRKIKIGIMANSYMNYAKGSEGSINTGVGIASDIPIGKKLKISTGIALAQNSLKFQSSTNIPGAAVSDFNTSVASKAEASAVDASLPGFANPTNTNLKTYSLSNYNASLLGLDLPVNIKYSVFKKKSELYFSAGLSSNFYIEENYSYSFQEYTGSVTTTQEEDDNTGKSKFQNFDFARMLNFSIGFEQPISKKSQLSLEPFIKYPLGGQGARDIRFGSVGMNLKLNISKSANQLIRNKNIF